jgi:hypothetical protein
LERRQIYACTVDNGANMVATVNLMKNSLEDESDDTLFDLMIEEDISWSSSSSATSENIEQPSVSDIEDSLIDVFNFNDSLRATYTLIRCAAHSLQLSIWDFLKDKSVQAVSIVFVDHYNYSKVYYYCYYFR